MTAHSDLDLHVVLTDDGAAARTVTHHVVGRETVTPYDSLIVAAGAGQSYFGHDEFSRHAPGMKSIDDALELRGRIFGSFELADYPRAEKGYTQVLAATPENDESHAGLVDNLAASIYKQGEQAKEAADSRAAADHFLRVAQAAPDSKIRPLAEYDAASALIQLKDWTGAAQVLEAFRQAHPDHALIGDATRQLAFVHREAGKLADAASEYERIAAESKDPEMQRESLLEAAGKVLGKRAGEETYAAVLVLATDRADVNGVIRKHLGVRKISFAAQDDAVRSTGMEYGGITPIGLPADWPVLVDEAVVAAGPVVIGSGTTLKPSPL